MLFLVYLFVIHFIADFLWQSRWMATNKSSNLQALSYHIAIIFLAFFGGSLIAGANLLAAATFSFANAAIHALIDWNIWRGYKWYVLRKFTDENGEVAVSDAQAFHYWEDHWFYATIGLDQFLHGATILLLVGVL